MNDFETAKQFFIEGLNLLAANNLQGAEKLFAQSLQILPERVSTLNNLSAIKIKLGKFAEAEDFALKAVALDGSSPEAWSNLGLALAATGRPQEALRVCDRALECNSSYAMAWLATAVTLRNLKNYVDALAACDKGLKLDPDNYQILYNKSLLLKALGQQDEAREVYGEALSVRVASSPVFVGERCATQKAEVLIVNGRPAIDDSLKSFEDLAQFCPNFPGQLAGQFHEDFHFNYVFVGAASKASARKQIPRPDFVLNNHVNAELVISDGNLLGLTELIESFAVPVINHPTKAVQTARDISAKRLEGISGVVVPKTLRFSTVQKTCAELIREIEEHFNYPVITRTLSSQEGYGMNKVDSPEGLLRVISAPDCPAQFFVTQFIDSRGENKFFRKIRAAVVRDESIIIRVDHSPYWNVHGRKSEKSVPFYLANAHLMEEEKRICNDPEACLGRSAFQALRAIRDRIPLDVFGIDFAVDPDGVLVFYEANATMNLFSTARKEIPNPKEAGDCLKLALQRYFTSLVPRLA